MESDGQRAGPSTDADDTDCVYIVEPRVGNYGDVRLVYQEDDLVFAKVKGYPWWPARVMEVLWKKKINTIMYLVNFYGTNEEASLKDDELKPYDTKTRQTMALPKRLPVFNRALYDIEKEYQRKKKKTQGNTTESQQEKTATERDRQPMVIKTEVAASPPDTTRAMIDQVIKFLEWELGIKEALQEGSLDVKRALEILEEVKMKDLGAQVDALLRAPTLVATIRKLTAFSPDVRLRQAAELQCAELGKLFPCCEAFPSPDWFKRYNDQAAPIASAFMLN